MTEEDFATVHMNDQTIYYTRDPARPSHDAQDPNSCVAGIHGGSRNLGEHHAHVRDSSERPNGHGCGQSSGHVTDKRARQMENNHVDAAAYSRSDAKHLYVDHVTNYTPENMTNHVTTSSGAGSRHVSIQGEVRGAANQLAPLEHVDFWPRCVIRANRACDATYERFGVLVERANKWLDQFPTACLINCETLDKKVVWVRDIYNSSMNFIDEDEGVLFATHIKGLRLWYLLRQDMTREEAGVRRNLGQFAYCDVAPRHLNPNEKHPIFETAPQLMSRLNHELACKVHNWNIVGAETVNQKVGAWEWNSTQKLDTSVTSWLDHYNSHQIAFYRIFYFVGDYSCCEQLGLEDFSPDTIDEGGIFHPAKYSSFSTLVKRATHWIAKEKAARILNIQTLDTKHRKKSELGNNGCRFRTDRMFEYEIEGRFRAFYIRVSFKHCSTHGPPQQPLGMIPNCHVYDYEGTATAPKMLPPRLGCKTFIPLKRRAGCENITEVQERAAKDIRLLNTNVFFVQTVCFPEWVANPALCERGQRTFYDGEWYFVPDKDGNEQGPFRYPLLYALRVYFDSPPVHKDMQKRMSVYGNTRRCCSIL